MGTLKEWLGWIGLHGVVPTAVLLSVTPHLLAREVLYYLVVVPPILFYFFLLGWLGLKIPGEMRETKPEDAYHELAFFWKLPANSLAGRILGHLRTLVILIGFPMLGAACVFHAVRDGMKIGYFFGPAFVWVSGGFWAMLVQFLQRKRVERSRQAGGMESES